jgi:hypothetical protein
MQRIPVHPFHGTTTASTARRSIAVPAAVGLCEHTGAARAEAEAFIRERFARCFGARVDAFMPRLFSLRNEAGEICGAFGLRSAAHRLFLEQYLDAPIEREIAARFGHPVERRAVVEVGQFCGTYPGVVRAMIRLLTEHLHDEGYEWVAFTGTVSLRNAFSRMGLSPLDMRAADSARLPATTRSAWGSYYEHVPRVLVGQIAQAVA